MASKTTSMRTRSMRPSFFIIGGILIAGALTAAMRMRSSSKGSIAGKNSIPGYAQGRTDVSSAMRKLASTVSGSSSSSS